MAVEEQVLDVREMPPWERHPRILETFEALGPGESMLLINDHDPMALHYQFTAEHPGQFTWEYVQQFHKDWRVRITRVG